MNIVSAVQRGVERSRFDPLISLFLPQKLTPPPDTTYQKIVRLRSVFGDIDRSIGGSPVPNFGERVAEIVLFQLDPYTQEQIWGQQFYEEDRLDRPTSVLPMAPTSQLGKSGITYRDINYILSGREQPPKEMTNTIHLFLALSDLVFSELDRLERRHQAHTLDMNMLEAAYHKAGVHSGAHPFNEPERAEFGQILERIQEVIGVNGSKSYS